MHSVQNTNSLHCVQLGIITSHECALCDRLQYRGCCGIGKNISQGRSQDFCRRVSSQPVQEGFAAPLNHSCKFNYKSIKF